MRAYDRRRVRRDELPMLMVLTAEEEEPPARRANWIGWSGYINLAKTDSDYPQKELSSVLTGLITHQIRIPERGRVHPWGGRSTPGRGRAETIGAAPREIPPSSIIRPHEGENCDAMGSWGRLSAAPSARIDPASYGRSMLRLTLQLEFGQRRASAASEANKRHHAAGLVRSVM